MTDPLEVLDTTVREQWGRLTSLLLARFRRLDLVEDAMADAVEAATRHWPTEGAPSSPAAWLMTTARRRLIDQLRAETMMRRRAPLLVTDAERAHETGRAMADPGDVVDDDLLRLVMMCAHPALAPESASALALRLVVGVSTADIARLFLVPEPTMAARITRAKKKVVSAGIPFAIPGVEDLPARLDSVAQTAYLAFTAGYAPGSGPDLVRAEFAGSAITLARVASRLRPDEPVLVSLLALMLFQHSRRDARVGEDGRLVLLRDQDRSAWHHAEIAEATDLLADAALRGPMGPPAASYAIQARIASEHALAKTPADVDWGRIVKWYDALLQVMPSPATRLARAVAVAESGDPAAGLAALDGLSMPGSHRLEAVRAELHARNGDVGAARAAYDLALEACHNDAEHDHLVERRAALGGHRPDSPAETGTSRPMQPPGSAGIPG